MVSGCHDGFQHTPAVPWRCSYCGTTLALVRDGCARFQEAVVILDSRGARVRCSICGHYCRWEPAERLTLPRP